MYFKDKSRLYGYKTEVSVLPNGFAINSTKHHPGIVSDTTIFRGQDFQKLAFEKLEEETIKPDEGEFENEFPEKWAVFVDKGYQGLQTFFRVIIPEKDS